MHKIDRLQLIRERHQGKQRTGEQERLTHRYPS